MIREIVSKKELKESVNVLRKSFLTVAHEFNLTKETVPSNPAFITLNRLEEMQNKGIKLFGLYSDKEHGKKLIGFIAIEKADDFLYYLEKLAVLPEYRHRGYGKKLLDFASDYVNKKMGKKISIGIINENLILKNWYKKHNFIETGIKLFDHLPFTVCYLEKEI